MNMAIHKDVELLDKEMIVRELLGSYWANQRTPEQILKSLDHSHCFGIFDNNKMVGFARVISDHSTFSYLCDVFVVKEKQGQGFGQRLLEYVLSDPGFSSTNWLLRTKDAHRLYEKFDFFKTTRPDRYMEKSVL